MTPSTLGEIIERAASLWPTKLALMDENGAELSYRDLESHVNIFCQQFIQSGLMPGERAAILSRNSLESVTAYFALIRAGAVVIWLNHSLDGKDLAMLARDAGLSLLVHENGLKEKADKLSSVFKSKTLVLEDIDTRQVLAANHVRPCAEGELATIVYTSGSTDKPLGVMLTHKNLISNNLAIADYLRLTHVDCICCVLPFYYIYGLSLLFSHFLVGGCVLLENRFSYPQVALDAIEAKGATGFSGVSSHYILLMNRTDFLSRKLTSLRYLTHAGDKMPVPVTEKILKAFPGKDFFLMYGQTEAAPRISYLEPRLASKKPAAAGRALKGIELRILNEVGEVCRIGEEGEIVIRGDNVMKGYWNNPEETRKVLRDGWLLTGDIAYLDEDGDFFVTGRKKQFVKVGGRRVNPSEVEILALEFPGIKEATAIGVSDEILGERLRLYLVKDPARPVAVEDIMNFYRARFPFYKIPSEILFVTVMPRNSQGKIDRQRLATIGVLKV